MIRFRLVFTLEGSLLENEQLLKELNIFSAEIINNSIVYINHEGGTIIEFENHFNSFLSKNENVSVEIV